MYILDIYGYVSVLFCVLMCLCAWVGVRVAMIDTSSGPVPFFTPIHTPLHPLIFASPPTHNITPNHSGDRILCEAMDATIATVTTQHEPLPIVAPVRQLIVIFDIL
jgi:hypothetical protein